MKGLRVAGAKTIEQANEYLTETYLAWWERELTVEAANSDDAHRPLEKVHDLTASLSHVEKRQVRPDYTIRWDGKVYRIERSAVTAGLRGANVRTERRLDGSLAVRYEGRYLPVQECAVADKPNRLVRPRRPSQPRKAGRAHVAATGTRTST